MTNVRCKAEPPELGWKELSEPIKELYVNDSIQLEVVMNIMQYFFHFSRTRKIYMENFLKLGIQKIQRSRKACALAEPPFIILRDVFISEIQFYYSRTVPAQISIRQYENQIAVLVSIHRYLNGAFDSEGKTESRWSADMFDFRHPDKIPSGSLAWQMLSDQAYSVSALLRMSEFDKAELAMTRFLEGVKQAGTSLDPSILVKFWRICLGLCGIDGRFTKRLGASSTGRAIPSGKVGIALEHGHLRRFLECLAGVIRKRQNGSHHPLFRLVTAMMRLSPTEVKNTIRLGCWASIKTLTESIGDENLMVLRMYSEFYRYWDEERSNFNLMEKLSCVGCTHIFCSAIYCERRKAVAFHAAYTAYYICQPKEFRAPRFGEEIKMFKELEKAERVRRAQQGREIQSARAFGKEREVQKASRAKELRAARAVKEDLQLAEAKNSGESEECTGVGTGKESWESEIGPFSKIRTLFADVKSAVEIMKNSNTGVRWSLSTQALSFSAKALGLFHHKGEDEYLCSTAMDTAIELLRVGDVECRIRAALLSKTLCSWLRFEEREALGREQERYRIILDSIPGGGCQKCEYLRLCVDCFPQKKSHKKPAKDTRGQMKKQPKILKEAPISANGYCQKCKPQNKCQKCSLKGIRGKDNNMRRKEPGGCRKCKADRMCMRCLQKTSSVEV